MLFRTLHTFFCKFHIVPISQIQNIWLKTSVKTWKILFELSPFWTVSKTIFVIKMPNNAEFILREKILKKINVSLKIPYFLINFVWEREREIHANFPSNSRSKNIYIYIYITGRNCSGEPNSNLRYFAFLSFFPFLQQTYP